MQTLQKKFLRPGCVTPEPSHLFWKYKRMDIGERKTVKRLCRESMCYGLSLTTQRRMDEKGEPPLSSQPRHQASLGPSEDLEMNFPLSGDTEDWLLPHPWESKNILRRKDGGDTRTGFHSIVRSMKIIPVDLMWARGVCRGAQRVRC